MLEVTVSLYGFVRDLAPQGKVKLSLPQDATVAGLLQALVERLGEEFRERAFAEDGSLHPSVKVLVDGEIVEECGTGLSRAGRTAISVVIIPPVIGGKEKRGARGVLPSGLPREKGKSKNKIWGTPLRPGQGPSPGAPFVAGGSNG